MCSRSKLGRQGSGPDADAFAGVIDEDIEPARAAKHVIEQSIPVRAARGVGPHAAHTEGRHPICGRAQGGFAPPRDPHPGSGPGERPGDSGTVSARTAGDDCDLGQRRRHRRLR